MSSPSTSASTSAVPAVPAMPAAFFMCTEAECQERQSSGEISVFESIWPPPRPDDVNDAAACGGLPKSPRGKQSRRIVDPHYAMTKYRRSAAGFDAKNRAPSRSIQQLECCVSQLEYILSYQQKPPPPSSSSTSNDNHNSFPQQTLCGTVGFVEDRIRAMQVDMVVSEQPSAAVQYRIVKCHILSLYLLNSVATYESTFGRQALSAALTNYWEEQQQQNRHRDDDILCFMALQQLSQYYTSDGHDESSGTNNESLSFILDYYRRNVQVRQQCLSEFPKFQWALQLLHLAVMGRPQSILRQLAELGGDNDSGVNCSTEFAVLCRCCMAPAIDSLRFQALDQYNKAYMKGEKVHIKELARLLYFVGADDAGDFCVQMAGLTKHDDNQNEAATGDSKIVFKVGPVSKNDKLDEGRRQDEFVFGNLYSSNHWGTSPVKSKATAWDDAPETADVNDSDSSNPKYTGARIDAEGVFVPPPALLHRILTPPVPPCSGERLEDV